MCSFSLCARTHASSNALRYSRLEMDPKQNPRWVITCRSLTQTVHSLIAASFAVASVFQCLSFVSRWTSFSYSPFWGSWSLRSRFIQMNPATTGDCLVRFLQFWHERPFFFSSTTQFRRSFCIFQQITAKTFCGSLSYTDTNNHDCSWNLVIIFVDIISWVSDEHWKLRSCWFRCLDCRWFASSTSLHQTHKEPRYSTSYRQ